MAGRAALAGESVRAVPARGAWVAALAPCACLRPGLTGLAHSIHGCANKTRSVNNTRGWWQWGPQWGAPL